MRWPLDPGFGSAVGQRAPARPAHRTTSLFLTTQTFRARQALTHTDAPRLAPSPLLPTRSSRGRPRKIERPQRFPQRDHPIEHLVADPGANPEPWTEVRPGARAQTDPTQHAHAPPGPPGAAVTMTALDTPAPDK
jgi:hypothetical protein